MKKIRIRYMGVCRWVEKKEGKIVNTTERPFETIGFLGERRLRKAVQRTLKRNKEPMTIDEVMEKMGVVEKNGNTKGPEGLEGWTEDALHDLVRKGRVEWDAEYRKDGRLRIGDEPAGYYLVKKDTRYWPKE